MISHFLPQEDYLTCTKTTISLFPKVSVKTIMQPLSNFCKWLHVFFRYFLSCLHWWKNDRREISPLVLHMIQISGIWTRIEQQKPIFVEPKVKAEFCTAMDNFYDRISSGAGAVFAAVCRGKVHELIQIPSQVLHFVHSVHCVPLPSRNFSNCSAYN